jgi:hypothetical protein
MTTDFALKEVGGSKEITMSNAPLMPKATAVVAG